MTNQQFDLASHPVIRASLQKVFDKIPKGKATAIMPDMINVELTVNAAFVLARMLNNVRDYFLEHGGGEESPFVKKIDQMLARPEKKPEAKS